MSDLRFSLPAELLELSLAEMAERLEGLPEAPELGSLKARVEALRLELDRLVASPVSPPSRAAAMERDTQFVSDVLEIEAAIAKLDDVRRPFTSTMWRARARANATRAS